MMPGLNKMQTTTFFMSLRSMEVMKQMLVELGKEEIKEAKDLAEFDKELWDQVADNLKCLGGQMKNLNKDANKTSMVP
eukprot:2081874-Ditylum_brightwellii.AAC.2